MVVHGTGKQMRTFTFVSDLVDANLASCLYEHTGGQTYNVASSIQVSILSLAERLATINGLGNDAIAFGDRLIGDIDYFDVSNKKCIDELGVGFQTDFWGTFESVFSDIKKSLLEEI